MAYLRRPKSMTSTLRAFGARARHGSLRTLLIAGAALGGTGLAVSACSGSASSGTGGGGAAVPRQAGAPAAGAPSAQKAAGDFSGNTGASGTHAITSKLAKVVLPARSIIYTANLSLRVTKGSTVSAKADQAANIVTAVGGYVSGEQEVVPPGKHRVPEIDLTLKIPSAQYAPILAKLKGLGERISFNSHAVDVTQEVADVASRVTSAQSAIKQLRALLSHAGSVTQLLTVQQTINRQESDLEALLAQQRALAHETSYATVTVVLVGHHAPVPPPKPKKSSPGFVAGLKGGWHALVTVVGWVVTVLGSLLPFLVPIAVLAAIALAGRRRLARRKAPPASEPPAPAAS
jgi:hypothetical protein